MPHAPSCIRPPGERHRSAPRPSSIWHVLAFSALLLASLSISGCGKSKPTEAKPPAPAVNSDAPNANARILSQRVFGDADKKSAVWTLQSAGLSEWSTGLLNYTGTGNAQVVGRLDAAGNLVSHSAVNYEPRDIVALSASSHIPGGAIVVGAYDNDGDGASEIGYATLFGATGTPVDQLLIASDSSDVWLNAIAPFSDSVFVVVGGERTPSRLNPLVEFIALTAGGTLEKRQAAVITSISGQRAFDVATDPGDALAPTRRVFLSVEPDDIPAANSALIYGIDVNASTLAPWSVVWNRTLTGKGVGTVEQDMRVFGDALYVVGYARDPDKGTPSNGGTWASGLVARLSLAGDIGWAKVVALSTHGERLDAIEPTGNAIIAMGEAASYLVTSTNDLFGYGWVARLAPADGGTLSSFTFGDAGYASAFNAGYVAGSVLHVGGWTQRETNGGAYAAWWASLDLTVTGPPSVSTSAQLWTDRALPGEGVPRGSARYPTRSTR